jgi:internalin A
MKTTHGSLTGAVLLLALAPWTAVCIRADEAEDKAVKAIQDLGGRITRDMNAKDKPIVSVDLGSTKVTDAGLKHLAGLKQLQWLNLTNTKVTDVGLKPLARLKHLRELDLRNTKVTDAGLKPLAGLKHLRELDLRNTKVTDAGLKHLAGLKQLQLLLLSNTRVTDKGIADLKKVLPNLVIE